MFGAAPYCMAICNVLCRILTLHHGAARLPRVRPERGYPARGWGAMLQLTARQADRLREVARNLEEAQPEDAALLRAVAETYQSESSSLTTRQAAQLLGVSTQTIRNWVDRGWLEGRRPRRLAHRRIPSEAVARLLDMRGRIERAAIKPLEDAAVNTVLSAYREDRRRTRSGEPLAGPREGEAPGAAMAGRR